MKKLTKRILCSVLSLSLASTLAVEHVLRLNAESSRSQQTQTAGVAYKDVTGQYDTSAIREANFNSSVQENSTPTYETRTVLVSLEGDCLADTAGNGSVSDFAASFTGKKVRSDISSEQNAFLKKLSQAGISYKVDRTYQTLLNAVAVELDTKHVSSIKEMSGVESVVITTTYAEPKTYETSASQEVFNQTSVYGTGIYDSTKYTDVTGSGVHDYGEGMVVAILDTGLDYTHNAYQRAPQNAAWSETTVEGFFAAGATKLNAEKKSGSLSASDVYVSAKVPFAYDYADDDADVYPSYSNHGTHVAGIIGGYDESGYTDKDGNIVYNDDNGNGVWDDNESVVTFRGVVPDAQLVICKVFTDDLDDPELGGAEATDIIAALEDCVTLGVDVINMSLGTSCGFTTTNDGDDEGELLNAVYDKIKQKGISLVCAASNDYSSAYGGEYGTNLTSNPDSGTVGSPSTFAAALSVASISGQESPYMVAKTSDGESFVFYEESRDENGNPYDFAESMLKLRSSGEFEYVVIPGTGLAANYSASVKNLLRDNNGNSRGRIALIQRGDSTFQEKVELAMSMGAIGVIVYNNVAGIIRMNLGEIDNPVPSVSIDMDAGAILVEAAKSGESGRVGTVTVSLDTTAGPFMSEFSSWGPTHDLKLKPEITAHGGEITSTVPGGYGEQSGTSMASPNMAGVMAIVRSYIEKDLASLVTDKNGNVDPVLVNRLANQLMMSTATTVRDSAGRPYSPRKQGAGLGSLENVIDKTSAYLYTDSADNDYRPKLEIGDTSGKDEEDSRIFDNLDFGVTNFGSTALTFNTDQLVLTETISKDGLTVAEQAYTLSPQSVVWKVKNALGIWETVDGAITVQPKQSVEIHVTITLSDDDIEHLSKFENGMYVEGFLKLLSQTEGQCDLSIPFLGFYGDWYSSPMLDYTAFEVAADDQNASKLEEEKIKASVWATQPYATYYNKKYIIPMGGFVYILDEDDDPVYADEAHCAVSRYNDYVGDYSTENYLTSTAVKAVYAGLLRNAKLVRYKLYNTQTGEVIIDDGVINRVGKAYTGGGSAVPANVEVNISPEEYGLLSNGQYTMEFDFFAAPIGQDENGKYIYPDEAEEENTYSFTFTVDYEAPVLEDVRVRYYNYKDGTKEKQRIYLDVDVYDNHYAQALLLCYPEERYNIDTDETETVLQLATDYVTPVRNANKNGTTTVSIEITDLYEKYGDRLYVQLDDYALNSCLYMLDLKAAQGNVLPDSAADFGLAAGEESLTLGLYETHKVQLDYTGEADLSNFEWESMNENVAKVKNGEIVGLSVGTTTVKVKNRKGQENLISVTVTGDTQASLAAYPFISFDVIKTDGLSLKKAEGTVPVNAGETFRLEILKDPWYHPANLNIVWQSLNPDVATVDQNGNVKTLKKGTAIITASIKEEPLYMARVTLSVQNEFTVSNYTLTDYNGVGYNEGSVADGTDVLVIPSDLNIMYIGAEAFKDNDNIRRIVIPSSVTQINERAFENCTALEEVYFVSIDHREKEDGSVDTSIDWSDLSLMDKRAFYKCTKLKKLDLSNVKVITIAENSFYGCTSLAEVVDMPSIGTMHHRAFYGCTSLTSVDLTGLFVAGNNVFENCTSISSIKTGKYTVIGNYMFKGCTGLKSGLTLSAPKIGEGAFMNCTYLPKVTLQSPEGTTVKFDIGAYAFVNCGVDRKSGGFSFVPGNEKIVGLGSNAFAKISNNSLASTVISEIALGDSFDLTALNKAGLSLSGLTVTVSEGCTKYTSDNGVIIANATAADGSSYKRIAFVNGSVTGAYAVPSDVTAIGPYAFANSKVTSIKLHAGVTEIGEGAFESSSITAIDFNGAAIGAIPARAFYGSQLADIVLPESVTAVGEAAFANSALASFAGAGLETVGAYAFYNCDVLREVTLAESLTSIGDYAFAGVAVLKEISLPAFKLDENGNSLMGSYIFSGASVQNVIFASGSQTTGNYTFIGSAVSQVTLPDGMTEIGEGAFMGCTALTSVTLPSSVTKIGSFAFANATLTTFNDMIFLGNLNGKLTAVNLGNVEEIGKFAFYNTELETLDLASAKRVGYGAFASAEQAVAILLDFDLEDVRNTDDLDESVVALQGMYFYFRLDGDVAAKYTNATLSLPVVEYIGGYAFYNGGEAAVALSENLRFVGAGTFASSANLKKIELGTANENASFAVKNNVLYRYVGEKANKEYELVCYPAALEAADGKYAIEEGTLVVLSSAFEGLNAGVVDEVVLPHSVNAIGDLAFYHSGVQTYTFESVQAPALETIYREEIRLAIESQATSATAAYYKGYYYANFETELYYFTSFGSQKSTLTMNYPVNGVGYNNYIYKLYFGTRNTTSIVQTDNTRECIAAIEGLPTANTILGWTTDGTTADEITQFSKTVQSIRLLYDNAISDSAQAQFITDELTEKLLAVESALREVKTHFGITTTIKELKVDSSSTHRTTYTEGETFDMTGLVVVVVYNDGSSITVGADQLTLVTTSQLGIYDRTVTYKYTDGELSKTGRITITVEEAAEPTPPDSSSGEDSADSSGKTSEDVGSSEGKTGCKSSMSVIAPVVGIVMAVAVLMKKRRED